MSDISVNITISTGITANVSVGANPSPAGSDKEIQYNDGGARGADENLTWDKTNKILTIEGEVDANTIDADSGDIETLASKTATVGSESADGSLAIIGKANVVPETVTFANPLNCNCATSNNHKSTITGDAVVNLTNLSAGMSGVISLLNDGVGSHAVTLGAAFTKELNGSDDYDDTADKYNLINWYYDGTEVFYTICNEA